MRNCNLTCLMDDDTYKFNTYNKIEYLYLSLRTIKFHDLRIYMLYRIWQLFLIFKNHFYFKDHYANSIHIHISWTNKVEIALHKQLKFKSQIQNLNSIRKVNLTQMKKSYL